MIKVEKQDFEIKLNLPWPPSVNHLYMRTLRGVFLTQKAKQYYDNAEMLLRLNPNRPKAPICEDVQIEFKAYPPDRRKRDQDNLEKVLNDSLVKGGILEDDSLIRRKIIEFFRYNKEYKTRGVDIIITPYVPSV